MTQRGIELIGLDGHYVSSLCWYILNTLGLRGITALLIGEATDENDAQVMMQAQMMVGGQSMNTDTGTVAAGEKEALDFAVAHTEKFAEKMSQIERSLPHRRA